MGNKFVCFFLVFVCLQSKASNLNESQLLTDGFSKSYKLEKAPSLDCAYGLIKCSSNEVYDLLLYKVITFIGSGESKISFKFLASVGDKVALDVITEVMSYEVKGEEKAIGKQKSFAEYFDLEELNEPFLVDVDGGCIKLTQRRKNNELLSFKFKKGNISETLVLGVIVN